MTGIYGGSFNPIHEGHLQLGEWLCKEGHLDELWFLVSPLNPLKKDIGATLLDDKKRLHLAELAVLGHPQLQASGFEMTLPLPSYMVHTLEALRREYPEKEFALVIGADNWLCFHQWKDPDEILRHHRVFIYPRNGYAIDMKALPEGVVYLQDAPLYDISSTIIRNAIASGDYNGEWLTPAVWQEIQKESLYTR